MEPLTARRDPIGAALDWAFASWRLPALLLFAVLLDEALLLAVLALPTHGGELGAFAEDFKTWCLGYDPATGRLSPLYAATVLLEPLALGAGVVLLWGRPMLADLRARPRAFLPSAVVALLLTGLGALAFGLLRSPKPAEAELPFPAEALRLAHPAPAFALTNQDGQRVELAQLKGKVVLLTGVYASCGYTCPMILGQAKRAVATLPPEAKAQVAVVGITLDPEHDTPERLAAMARGQHVAAPLFNLVTGPTSEVGALLDRLEIQRSRDPKTGIIDHANLFILVDRQGRIAYRFTLGERQERWLSTALALLAREEPT